MNKTNTHHYPPPEATALHGKLFPFRMSVMIARVILCSEAPKQSLNPFVWWTTPSSVSVKKLDFCSRFKIVLLKSKWNKTKDTSFVLYNVCRVECIWDMRWGCRVCSCFPIIGSELHTVLAMLILCLCLANSLLVVHVEILSLRIKTESTILRIEHFQVSSEQVKILPQFNQPICKIAQ